MNITRISSESSERIHVVEDGEILLTVAPWFGAKLSKLKLRADQQIYDLLWETNDDDLEKNNWYKQSILFPYPNRLEDATYKHEGKEYIFPMNELAKNNQLHGMLYNSPFSVNHAEMIDNVATISLSYIDDGSRDYYPFPFIFTVVYEYSESGLKTTFEVQNTGDKKLPFGIGWHPYFQFDKIPVAQTVFEAGESDVIEMERKRSLPTGGRSKVKTISYDLETTYLDDAFELSNNPSYALKLKSGLSLNFECDDELNYLQVFTPEGGEAVAIEPMTCNVNAFNNHEGLRYLDDGHQFSTAVRISLQN